ncbi:MAG: sensor histidine kinase [Spirochaetales bacterium]|nr:sensor histidine kinase [Spirochaetales bacterium]
MKQKILICAAFYLAYALLFLLLTPLLKVSVNYLIIPPIVSVAFCFGLAGGAAAGFLGLPMNLLLFHIGDSLPYAPASLLMAQLSGILVGTGLGLAGSYYDRTSKEIRRREKREEELKVALEEKEILYKELNHRVKNNLNIIKSLIQMQVYRTSSDDFKQEGNKLINRILSISLVHEQLYKGHIGEKLNLRDYLIKLIKQVLISQADYKINLIAPPWDSPLPIPTDKAIPVGLIINEVVTNSIKYAFEEKGMVPPEVRLTVDSTEEGIIIKFFDNGSGRREQGETEGLGTTLIQTLTKQLSGEYAYIPLVRGTGFSLTFPLEKNPSPSS